jgi:predicted PurR-regulated permease PerM
MPELPPDDPQEPPRVLLHMPVDVRNMALGVLAAIATLAALRVARGFFIPLMLGLVFTYAMSPVVEGLKRWRIPRALSAAVLIVAVLGGSGGAVYALSDDANQLIATLPQAAAKLRDAMRKRAHIGATPLDTVQKAAAELQGAAEPQAPSSGRSVQHVVVERPGFDVREHLWSGTVGLGFLVGQIVVVTFLTYFLLLSGDMFRRKLVKVIGPTLTEKKLAVQALDEINAQMQRYLLVQLLSGVGVGLTTGAVFAWIGLGHAAVWAVAAGILTLVPYVGAASVTVGAMLVAFLQFGEIEPALYVGGASLAINTIKGYLLVPWATSRASRMNPAAVFVGVLAWGWLWGLWGLLLGVPILMAVKAVCDRVDHLKPLGELLGD